MPNALLNMAMNALGLSYPTSRATLVTGWPPASFTIPASSLAWHCQLRKVVFVSSENSRANVRLLGPTIEAHAFNVRPFAGSSLISVAHCPLAFQEHFRRFRDSIEGG